MRRNIVRILPRLILFTALFAALPAAYAVKYVAVVEVEIDARSGASDDLSAAEAQEITAELRREAVRNLPQDKYNIMTSETVQAQGGAVLEECAEENCVITLGSKIGADYIVRGIVRKFKTRLTLSVEMYETEDGTLVASSDPVRSENAAELLEKAAVACADMYKTFVSRRPAPKAPAAPVAVTHTVTATVNPANGGTVSRSPNQTSYESGAIVSITAVPANGYVFTGWSGASTSASATLTGPIDRDLTLTANFRYIRQTYKLLASAYPQGGGFVSLSPNKEAYASGERVTVTAAPENGYAFTGWTGAASGRKNRLTLTMDGDKALTANFYRKLELEPKPNAPAPKPDAGIAQDHPAKKRNTLIAAGLDALGAGIMLYGYGMDLSVRDKVDARLYGDAEESAGQRNVAYALGTLIMLSGISVHIFF
ncbi:MAG: InlB B-repeat-containing protein [Chitinispirillales bacterium]|jgi:uncharacterized repeat protein (TIGR02543 family)|nr:InlB B-repeat-containing protein [Chitinispirillales bacterium]